MIENFNDFLSLAFLIGIVIACVVATIKLNDSFRKDEEVDEYYRDLL